MPGRLSDLDFMLQFFYSLKLGDYYKYRPVEVLGHYIERVDCILIERLKWLHSDRSVKDFLDENTLKIFSRQFSLPSKGKGFKF